MCVYIQKYKYKRIWNSELGENRKFFEGTKLRFEERALQGVNEFQEIFGKNGGKGKIEKIGKIITLGEIRSCMKRKI